MQHRFGLLKPVAFVVWLLTYRCNLSCIYCEASSGDYFEGELNKKERDLLIVSMRQTGVKRVLLSGGEPLMHPDFFSILDKLHSNKITPGLLSNGVLISKYAEELKKYKYFFFQTSFDGLPEYHDEVRGYKGSVEKVFESLEFFNKLKTPVRIIHSVIHPKNLSQLEGMFELVLKSKATRWQLTPVAKVGRASENDYSLNDTDVDFVIKFIKEKRKYFDVDLSESHAYLSCFKGESIGNPFFCAAGLTRCSIMPDGEVLGCNQVYDNKYSEGNVKERSFEDIWKNGFKKFREPITRDECLGCQFLAQCQGGCWVEWQTVGACYKSKIVNKI